MTPPFVSTSSPAFKIPIERPSKQQPRIDDGEERERYDEPSEYCGAVRPSRGLHEHHRTHEIECHVREHARAPVNSTDPQRAIEPVEGRDAEPGGGEQLPEPCAGLGKSRSDARQDVVRCEQECNTASREQRRTRARYQ